jgi:hypothetical protein
VPGAIDSTKEFPSQSRPSVAFWLADYACDPVLFLHS